jgi:transposase
VPDRVALAGIIFVLKNSIPWGMLPQGMGCDSGPICWWRLRDWQKAGVRRKLHEVLLIRLGETDQIDWERASLDSERVPAKGEPKNRSLSDRKGKKRARMAILFWTEAVSRSR